MRPRMPTFHACLAAGAAVVLAGCGSAMPNHEARATRPIQAAAGCSSRTGFALSLVKDRGGQATPVAAAIWLGSHGSIRGIPRGGWRLVSENRDSATIASGRTSVHAIQGSDGTWQVDSGYACR